MSTISGESLIWNAGMSIKMFNNKQFELFYAQTQINLRVMFFSKNSNMKMFFISVR